MKININLLNNTLVAEDVQAEQANKVIDGFFGLLSNRKDKNESFIAKIEPTSVFTESKMPEAPRKTYEVRTREGLKSAGDNEKLQQKQSKLLPKIDDSRTLAVSIGEMIKPLITPSNIRVLEDGTKIYQTAYTCDCGHEGKRFIPETNDYAKCHKCGEKLLVEAATLHADKQGIPEPDIDGNFFIAREIYVFDNERN